MSNSTLFNGNSSKYGLFSVLTAFGQLVHLITADWVVDKGSIQNNNGDLVLILADANGGTRISSTTYVYYGTITARRGSLASSLRLGSLNLSIHISQDWSLGWRDYCFYYYERHQG